MALVVITGTGTGIGKTHLGEALLRAWSMTLRALGYKPIESGTTDGDPASDQSRLARASAFRVKPRVQVSLPDPLSPHLAARRAGVALDIDAIAEEVTRLERLAAVLLVELAGGLFTPLVAAATNAELVQRLPSHRRVVIAAPDRLGVLHDLGAVSRACAASGLALHGAVLVAPETPDTSTGTNAAELHAPPVLAVVPRAAATELARMDVVRALAEVLVT